ncbi:MAG: hypothetical protein ACRDTR_07940 [Rubrobacter sp.]
MFRLLEDFRGLDPLRRLFWSELNYDREDAPLSRRGWPDTVSGVLTEDPVVLATGADGGFEVIHRRLDSERLSLQAARDGAGGGVVRDGEIGVVTPLSLGWSRPFGPNLTLGIDVSWRRASRSQAVVVILLV